MSLTRSGSEGVKAATFPASSAVSLARARNRGGGGAGAHPPRGEASGVAKPRRRGPRCCPPGRARAGAGPAAAAGTSATTKKTTRRRRARERDPAPSPSVSRPDLERVGDPGARAPPGARNGSSRVGSRMRTPLTLLRFPATQAHLREAAENHHGFEWGSFEDFCPGNFLCVSPQATCVYAYVSPQAARLEQTA